jgi:hypothetical protein
MLVSCLFLFLLVETPLRWDFLTDVLGSSQRLAAEELSKLRWVRQQSKTSLSHLNDLLVNFQEWKAKGGQRMSLAEGVGAPINDE